MTVEAAVMTEPWWEVALQRETATASSSFPLPPAYLGSEQGIFEVTARVKSVTKAAALASGVYLLFRILFGQEAEPRGRR